MAWCFYKSRVGVSDFSATPVWCYPECGSNFHICLQDFLTMLSLWKKIRAFAEIRHQCNNNLSSIFAFFAGHYFHARIANFLVFSATTWPHHTCYLLTTIQWMLTIVTFSTTFVSGIECCHYIFVFYETAKAGNDWDAYISIYIHICIYRVSCETAEAVGFTDNLLPLAAAASWDGRNVLVYGIVTDELTMEGAAVKAGHVTELIVFPCATE